MHHHHTVPHGVVPQRAITINDPKRSLQPANHSIREEPVLNPHGKVRRVKTRNNNPSRHVL